MRPGATGPRVLVLNPALGALGPCLRSVWSGSHRGFPRKAKAQIVKQRGCAIVPPSVVRPSCAGDLVHLPLLSAAAAPCAPEGTSGQVRRALACARGS